MSLPRLKLKALMAEHEVIAADIARSVGVTRQTVSCVVRGFGRSERIETAIAKALKMDRDDIFPVIPQIINKAA
ncbi:MAG: helix-turn-helix transcriptional regulator [Pseudomonadota bacterium]